MRLNILLIQSNKFNNLLCEDLKNNFTNVVEVNSSKEYYYLNLKNVIDVIILDTSSFNIEHLEKIISCTLENNINSSFFIIGNRTLIDKVPKIQEINICEHVETYVATSEIVNKLKIYSRSLETHQTNYQQETSSTKIEKSGQGPDSTRKYMNLPTFTKQTNTTTFETPSDKQIESSLNTKKKSKIKKLLKM